MGFYVTIDGVEYYTINDKPISKSAAVSLKKIEMRTVHKLLPDFPLKIRIIKRKGGYFVVANNTIRNVREWERTGEIPREKVRGKSWFRSAQT